MALFDPFGAVTDAGSSVLNTISSIGKDIKSLNDLGKQKSLIELTSAARVEPLTIIGNDCVNLEYIHDVMQSMLAIFSGYYLQAVSLTTSVHAVRAVKNLDRLNPHREVSFLSGMPTESLKESMKYKLSGVMSMETYGGSLYGSVAYETVREESTSSFIGKHDEGKDVSRDELDHSATGISPLASQVSTKLSDIVKDNVNLSVGKLIDVTIEEDRQKIVIPIAIRLMVASVNDNTLEHLLSTNIKDNSFSERWHGWRAGRLSFIKDLILCQDLIDAHKKALIKDKSGVYADIISTANTNKLSAVFDDKGRQSLASASNLFVISEATAANIESIGLGKLKDPHFRAKIFESGYAMIIAVIDREWERVTFYHRGIALPTSLGIKDIKNATKGAGIDIGDVMKAFSAGSQPSF